MRRVGAWVLVLYLPVSACAQPRAELDPQPVSALPAEPRVDRRPLVGEPARSEDLTDLVKRQNAPGSEPALPTRKGVVTPARMPTVKRTDRGFVAKVSYGHTRGFPTPAYYKGRIYAGGHGTTTFHAMNAETGAPAWSLNLSDDGPTAPVCKDGVCVFNTFSCTMFGIDADSGRHLWSWWLGSPQLATPVVSGNTVYTSYPGERGGPEGASYVLAAFDLKTGTPKWRRWIDAEVNSTPVAFGGHVYVATQLGTLYEFGARDGEVLSARRSRAASPPIVTADALLFERAASESEGNDMLVTAHPVFPELEGTRHRSQRIAPRPRPLLVQHRLVTVEGNQLVAIHSKTGARLWQHHLATGAAHVSAPLIYAGRSILLATDKGAVLRMDPDSGEVTDTFELGSDALASQPIVHDGWIYAGTNRGTVIGHDTGQPELTGWEMLGGGPERQGSAPSEGS